MSEKLSFGERLRHSWNAFFNPIQNFKYDYGRSSYANPSRARLTTGNEKSIVGAVYNRIAIDVSSLDIKHVILDDTNERFKSVVDDSLNQCLTLSANKDQTSQVFIQDLVLSLFDEGVVAIVPVNTSRNPKLSESYDIESMRVGKILNWYPDHVKVRLYNDKTGEKEEIILPKSMVAIVENPFYVVMNEPNAVAKRLIRKLNILDVIDEQSASGKLDLIVQLPGVIKTEARRKQAEDRRKDIENQLAGSKYGIAYIDGTEKVTQLNRSVENNLMNQITFLTTMLYSQLGITEEVLNGTANEQTMLNYYNNTIVPVVPEGDKDNMTVSGTNFTVMYDGKAHTATAVASKPGSTIEYNLESGQQMLIDTGYLAMMDATVKMEIQKVKGVKNALFGGEGLFNTLVTGPGRVVIQTMPISGFAQLIANLIPKKN